MLRTLLYGKSGKRRAELHPIHRFTRLAYTFAAVKLSGESWRKYKREWIR